MKVTASLTPTQALRIMPGVPSVFSASATDRSPPWSPPKSWAWWNRIDWLTHWPTDLWGDCGYRRSDHGDGDENSSREQASLLEETNKTDRPQ